MLGCPGLSHQDDTSFPDPKEPVTQILPRYEPSNVSTDGVISSTTGAMLAGTDGPGRIDPMGPAQPHITTKPTAGTAARTDGRFILVPSGHLDHQLAYMAPRSQLFA